MNFSCSPDCHNKLSLFWAVNYWESSMRQNVDNILSETWTHTQSVAVLFILYKIRCNPMHPFNGALPGPYVPARLTRGALVPHRYTYAPPRCVPCSTARLLFPSRCPSGTILLTPYSGGFKEQGQCFPIGLSSSIPTIVFYSFSLSLLSVNRLVLWGWGLRTDRVYITLSQPCTADLLLRIITQRSVGKYDLIFVFFNNGVEQVKFEKKQFCNCIEYPVS